jgi:mannose-6-phosphate isomerase-like protein (cupin superfamily)
MWSSRWATEEDVTVESFRVGDLAQRLEASGETWSEFLRVPDMSLGVYRLPAGAEDPQSPHHEDEIYYVVSGLAVLRVGDREAVAVPGAVLFVEAEAEHRFERIEEDLTLLVVFAPAETE